MLFMGVVLLCFTTSCSERELDVNNPDVGLFVKQLKDGTYHCTDRNGVEILPRFSHKNIPQLLEYADDLSVIGSFPTLFQANTGKLRLGECLLWTVECIRRGMPPSKGCKLVYVRARNYEPAYFLTDEEVKDAVAYYRRWWDQHQSLPPTLPDDAPFDDPLQGSGYRWW